MQLDSAHYFYIIYDEGKKQNQQRLNNKDNSLVFDKNIFGDTIMKKGIQFNLYIICRDEDYPIKDSLNIVIIPWE